MRILSLSILLAASCGVAAAEVDFQQNVMPLIAENCVICHADNGVSFSLETADDVYLFRAAIAASVETGRMPPWLAEPGHQNYVGDYSLNADEKSVIAAWAAADFPRSGAATGHVAEAEVLNFDADLSVAVLPDGSYLPAQNRKDDYRCFVIDWPYDTVKYVTGFKASPGNMKIAHHLVNYVIGPEGAAILKTLSEEEEGPGHQCFGGPLPDSIAEDGKKQEIEDRWPGGWDKLVNDYYWLSQWAPGSYGLAFPQDTGIQVRPGSSIVVQMHYYSAFAPGEKDSDTTMHFTLDDSVSKPSINHPLSNNRWLFGSRNESMQIPPGENATFEVGQDFKSLARYAAFTLQIDSEEITALELRSANVHMHAFGASGKSSLLNSDGRKETLLHIPRWDLAWQRDFMFDKAKTITREEFEDTRLVVECTFTNYTDETVYGGYGSDDEMCFNFSYVSVIRDE